MNKIIPFLIFGTVIVPLVVLSSIMPYITRKTESFGIGIPGEAFYDPTVRALRKHYFMRVISSGIILLAGVFTLALTVSGSLARDIFTILMLAGISVLFLFYLSGHFRMKRLKIEKGWMEGKKQYIVADTAAGRDSHTASPLWFILYFALIIVTIWLGFHFYDKIPFRAPVKYDLAGNPSVWAGKSLGLVFFAPLMQFLITVIMIFIYLLIGRSKRPIDASKPLESAERSGIFRSVWSGIMILTGLVLLIVFGIVQISFTGLVSFRAGFFAAIGLTALLVIFVMYFSIAVGQGGSRIKLPAGGDEDRTAVSLDEDKFWKLGVFYFNPLDPAVFVEKRFGIGWSVNRARPASWLALGGLIGLVLAVLYVSGKFIVK